MIDYEGKISITYETTDQVFDKIWRSENLESQSFGTTYVNGKVFISVFVTPEEAAIITLSRRVVPHGNFW